MDEDMANNQPCKELQVLDVFNKQLIDTAEGASEVYNPIFGNIRIYGTSDYPVFVAKDVQDVLGLKNLRYKDDCTFEWDEDKIKIKAMTKMGIHEVIAFTELGLYRAIWMSKAPAAKQFQRFMTCVMKRLRQKGSVTINQALDDLKVENTRLKGTVKAYNIQMDAEHKELIHYKYEHDGLVMINHERAIMLNKAQEQLKNARDPNIFELQERLNRVMARSGRPIYIMLSEAPKEHKETHTYDLDEYSEWDSDYMDSSEVFIFSIGLTALKTKVSVKKIYVHKTVKLDDIHQSLARYRLEKLDRKGDPAGHYVNMYEISLDQLDIVIDDVNLADEKVYQPE